MTSPTPEKLDFTIALSGGGVAGLGHIPILSALDDLGIVPSAIAGTSMGAIIAACYGAGMSSKELEEYVLSITSSPISHTRKFLTKGWRSLMTAAIDPASVVDTIVPESVPNSLNDTKIPTYIVATDFNARKPVIFHTEDTKKSLAASIAIPGVFKPFIWNDRVLVDGGVLNNLPVDVLPASTYTVAVDVASEPEQNGMDTPGPVDSLVSSMRMLVTEGSRLKLEQRPNLLLVQPASRLVGPLDLHRMEEAISTSKVQADEFKRQLETIMNSFI